MGNRREVLSSLGVGLLGSLIPSVSARTWQADLASRGGARRVASPIAASGWKVEQAVRPNGLRGANGLRIAPDGRLYVAQVFFRRISAVDLSTGAVSVIVPEGGGGDDLDFDNAGNMYITAEDYVGVRSPGGATHQIMIPGGFRNVNGITVASGRVFVDEEAPGGG